MRKILASIVVALGLASLAIAATKPTHGYYDSPYADTGTRSTDMGIVKGPFYIHVDTSSTANPYVVLSSTHGVYSRFGVTGTTVALTGVSADPSAPVGALAYRSDLGTLRFKTAAGWVSVSTATPLDTSSFLDITSSNQIKLGGLTVGAFTSTGPVTLNSTTTFKGPTAFPQETRATSFTVSTQTVIIASPSANITITLPSATSLPGKMLYVKNITTYTATITPAGTEVIDDTNTYILSQKNGLVKLISDGTGWKILEQSIPVGTLQPYAGSTTTLPTGWLPADGSTIAAVTYPGLFAVLGYTYGGSGANFVLPDTRGIGLVGAGTTNRGAPGQDATGSSFTATRGQYYQDQFQGHRHKLRAPSGPAGHNSGGDSINIQWVDAGSTASGTFVYGDDLTSASSGGSGTPRSGNFTRGPSLGVNYIIKY